MAYDALGNYVPDDAVSVDDMRHELIAKSKTPQFIKNLEAMYQLLPNTIASRSTAQGVKPIAETVATVGSGLAAPFLGVAKGIGQNILNNTNERVDRPELAEAFTYQPRTQTGQNYVESIMGALDASRLPPYVAHAGQFRFTPDDLRVAGKTAVSDVRNFPTDFANARAGLQREYPTLGSTAASALTRAEPLLEKGLSMYESGQLTPGFTPISEAMKPKGGNWPTSLAAENTPLTSQGEIGIYLNKSKVEPMTLWFNDLPPIKKRAFNHFFENETGMPFEQFKNSPSLHADIANQFVQNENGLMNQNAQMAPGMDVPNTLKPVESYNEMANAYNNWILGPHKKYIQNQMGTGVETDPVLKLVEEHNMPLSVDRYRDPEHYANIAQGRRDMESSTLQMHKLLGESPSGKYFKVPETGYENVGIQTAKTPAGKELENLQDWAMRNYSWRYGPKSSYAESTLPYLSKLKENTPVYDVLDVDALNSTGLKDIKQQVIKSLMSGDISPENLQNKSVESIARTIIEDKIKAEKEAAQSKKLANDWRIANHQNMPAETTFTDVDGNPNGVKMFLFDENSNPDLVARNLSQDTKDLAICSGAGYRGTTDYPSWAPMVEPHTGKPPRGAMASNKSPHGDDYLRKILNGEMKYAAIRDANGNSQGAIQINDDGLWSIRQIKGKDNDKITPEFTEYVKNWLNQHADKIKEHVSDLKNLPGVIDILGEKPYHIADKYPELSEDKLNEFFNNLVEQKLPKLSPSTIDFYKKGYISPTEIISDIVPRFVTIDELKKIAQDQGYDILKSEQRIEDKNNMSITHRLGLKSMMDDYFQHGMPRDLEDYHDNFQHDVRVLAGDQNLDAILPGDEHAVLVDLLLNQDENKQDILALLNDPNQALLGWNDNQRQNMINIIENWLHIHPFEE